MRGGLFLTFFIALAWSYMNGRALLKYVREKQPGLYAKLGEPRLLDSNLSRQRLMLTKYVWSLAFLKQEDSYLTRHCWIALGCELILLVTFVMLILHN